MQYLTLSCFVSFLLCFSLSLAAQDLHIYYDAQNSTLRYEHDGKEVKRPKVKKDANIFLHVENYNNYLYDLEMEVNNQIVQIPSGGGMTNLLGVVGGNPMDFLSPGNFNSGAGEENFVPPIDPGSNIDDILDADGSGMVARPETYGSESANQQSAAVLAAMTTMQKMDKLEEIFKGIEEDIETVAERKEIRAIALEEVAKLKRNEGLPPEQIKRMSMEFLSNVLDVEGEKVVLDLKNVINKGDDRVYLKQRLQKLDSARAEYLGLVEELKTHGLKLEQLGSSDATSLQALNAVVTINTKVPSVLSSVEEEANTIKTLYQDAGKSDIQTMTSAWYEYEAISSNTFSHTYRTDAQGDRTALNIQFYKTDTSGNRVSSAKLDPVDIKVPVYGGLKVNISVGLNFGQFFDTPQDYFLKDTIIASEDSNEFLPMATSFIHFYPQRVSEVSIGGSFGIGVPLGGDDNISSINFFLGPSLILGKSKRVILNTGLMGGRVRSISQGLKVGDTVPAFSAIPTKAKYRMGYFLGISFNI